NRLEYKPSRHRLYSTGYGPDYYSKSPAKNPPGPSTGTKRVLRGGGWHLNTRYLRVAYRFDNGLPNYWDVRLGFRCVSGSP
ncbi:MAG: hypothetical protein QGH37_33315, partial [Candidatus Poribacteria bacterium]|nr:hypothetical protein [Candidatus Poribacteria bacterium]